MLSGCVCACYVFPPIPSISVCLLELFRIQIAIESPSRSYPGTPGCSSELDGDGDGSPVPCGFFGLMMWLAELLRVSERELGVGCLGEEGLPCPELDI